MRGVDWRFDGCGFCPADKMDIGRRDAGYILGGLAFGRNPPVFAAWRLTLWPQQRKNMPGGNSRFARFSVDVDEIADASRQYEKGRKSKREISGKSVDVE